MVNKKKASRVTFMPRAADGSVLSGQTLVCKVSLDGSGFTQTANQAVELDPAGTPGLYTLQLNSQETDANVVDLYVSASNVPVFHHEYLAADASDDAFNALFGEGETEENKATQIAFMERLADVVLKRTQSQAELSEAGNNGSINSLLGVISLMTQGQTVTGPDCNGQYWIYANSAVSGQPNLGALHIVYSADKVVGVLPHSGPNSVEQAGGGCSVTTANPPTVPGTFLPINGNC